MISSLPRDLAEEVLVRLPVTSLRGVRSTCKKLYNISTSQSFRIKHIAKAKAEAKNEFQVVMMIQYRVCLFSVNLLNLSIEPIGRLISLDDADRVDISQIFHCDGLLLCIPKDNRSKLVVWNPCSGQTRWIEPRTSCSVQARWIGPRSSYNVLLDRYALGYETKQKYSRRGYKVLRFMDDYIHDSSVKVNRLRREFEIYDLNSNSWNVVDVNPDWDIEYHQRGVSLMGNTYWFALEKDPTSVEGNVGQMLSTPRFLLCFDFTTESFGPRLALPFHSSYGDVVTLSSVRETNLAVLCQNGGTAYIVKIWISSKIEPNAVSWNKLFLKANMRQLTGRNFEFLDETASFFIDKKKKVAVILDKNRHITSPPTRNIAFIIGKKGYFKQVDLGESIDTSNSSRPPSTESSSSRTVGKESKEQFEPGVYVTYKVDMNGNKIFQRVRFSKKRFDEHQAEDWWTKNKDRLLKCYSQNSSSSNPTASDSPIASPTPQPSVSSVPEQNNDKEPDSEV